MVTNNGGRSISIRPSDFDWQEDLSIRGWTDLVGLSEITFKEFVGQYRSPTLTTNDRLHMKCVPDVWYRCAKTFPKSHLFVYTFSYMAKDPLAKEFLRVRTEAYKKCGEQGDEASLIWLNSRAKYVISMISTKKEVMFPAWDEEKKSWFTSSVEDYCLSARILFIVYSCRVMLDSGFDLGNWRPLIEAEWASFKNYAVTEIKSIVNKFGIKPMENIA